MGRLERKLIAEHGYNFAIYPSSMDPISVKFTKSYIVPDPGSGWITITTNNTFSNNPCGEVYLPTPLQILFGKIKKQIDLIETVEVITGGLKVHQLNTFIKNWIAYQHLD